MSSKLSSKFFDAPTDQQGKAIQFDVREDEEQQKKFQETIELLVAAGYFRARIKGLSAFDKIVGGMTWCITTCNFDVDVDLLFQESSTIGQKIALVERIVIVLPRMKCPHRIEPHQIQGLDFIHVYPVIQWLVKKAIETRAEMGDFNRSFALLQYSKINHEIPSEVEVNKTQIALKSLKNLKDQNAPQRKYIRKDLDKITDRQLKIQSTLLEYDQKNVLLSSIITQSQQQQQQQQQSAKLASTLKQTQDQNQQSKQNQTIIEEANLNKLINEMSETDQKQNKISANAVGQILGLQQSTLQQIVSDYKNKENELQQDIDQLEKLVSTGDPNLGGFQHQKRLINILNRQIEQKSTSLVEKQTECADVKSKSDSLDEQIENARSTQAGLQKQLEQMEDYEKNADKKNVDELERLVKIYDDLKQKENDFKKTCKDELAKLEEENEKLKEINANGQGDSEDGEKFDKINEQYETAKSKLHALRLKIAKKNREISTLKRKLDEIPSRTELSQYQKRFLELYNQISALYTQTKQFYILYNTIEDKRMHMNKVINLYNSINSQFNQAMSTQANREQFVKQLESIIEGVKNNLTKVDNKRIQGKSKLDKLNDNYVNLIEKKRNYFKILKDFQDECKKNETLLSQIQQ